MTDNTAFLRILWGNIVGDTKEQIESLSWTGVARYIVDQTGQMVITSLIPAGFIVAPMFGFFLDTVGNALDKTYEDWGEMRVNINEAGLAILDTPVSLATSPKKLPLPKTIELPVAELISPGKSLRLAPLDVPRKNRPDVARKTKSLTETLRTQRQPSNLVRETMARTGRRKLQDTGRLPSRKIPRLRLSSSGTEPVDWLRKANVEERSQQSGKMVARDVLYPEWALTGKAPLPGASTSLISLSDFNKRIAATDKRKKAHEATMRAAQKRLVESGDRVRKLGQDSIKRSRDQADRARKLQREQAERARRIQQHNRRQKK